MAIRNSYRAYQVQEKNGSFMGSVKELKTAELPDNEVLIRVEYSGLNYKDALSASGHKGVTKHYPHTPGIDAAGLVIESKNQQFKPGDAVLVTSYDLGMNTAGGFGQHIQVPADWILPLPKGLSCKESMILGTAGLTAAQGIYAMQLNGQNPDRGPVIVTGARGAVGTIAMIILSQLGYEVIAGVSKTGDDTDHLKSLGASEVVDAELTNDQSGRPLLKPKWAGAFDVVGGNTLATLLKMTSYGGNVVVVGNVGGIELNTTVFPFILNGVNLLGVGTQDTPMSLRRKLWDLLASQWKPRDMESWVTSIGFDQLDDYLKKMMAKKSRGRVLLNLE